MRDKRLLGFAIISLVFCISILQVRPLFSSTPGISAYGTVDITCLVVALDGSGDFTDIQSAIDAVPDGEWGDIFVRQGIYVLNPVQRWPSNQIVVKPRITLRGDGIDKTIIRMAPTPEISAGVRSDVITSNADVYDFRLKDLTVDQNAPKPDNAGSSVVYFRRGSHRDILLQRVKVINGFGSGIAIPRFNNVTIEECQISNVYTGINLQGGANGLVKGNQIVDITGNGIFPQALGSVGQIVTDVIIEDNYLENVGDVGIGVASLVDLPPHERIMIRNNTLKNAMIGVTGTHHVEITGNTIEIYSSKLPIYADAAQGRSTNVTVEGNKIHTSSRVGIGFYTAQDCRALNNEITMLSPSGGVTQTGIYAAIYGVGLIEGNTIVGSANYGIDFGGWALSDSDITIRGNKIFDFGDIGIYDNAVNQGSFLVENNTVWDRSDPFISRYGIRTGYVSNRWIIRYNHVYAGSIAYISAPSSNVYGNIYESL